MAKERKRLINEDMVQDQPTTIPARGSQSNRTPGRDNMGQEEVNSRVCCKNGSANYFGVRLLAPVG